jgi:nucleoside 2-deoxyribosyltransferase
MKIALAVPFHNITEAQSREELVSRLEANGFNPISPVIDKDEGIPLERILRAEETAIADAEFLLALADGKHGMPLGASVMIGIACGKGIPIVTFSRFGFGLNPFINAMVEKHCFTEFDLFEYLEQRLARGKRAR